MSALSWNARIQLADEEIWQNPNDEWLDYSSTSSEEEDEGTGTEGEGKIEGPNGVEEADPLYNAKADETDAKWVEKNLEKYLQDRTTDALLNCPACFTLLCLDCQRHETYLNQYRAMFVRNCKVYKEKELKYRKVLEKSNKQKKKEQWREKIKQKKKQKKVKKEGEGEEEMELEEKIEDQTTGEKPFEFVDKIMVEDEGQFDEEIYMPVHCSVCDVQVAVMDEEEVYHFFNVAPSEA